MNQLGNNDAFVLEGHQTSNQATQEALLTEDLHPALFQDENRVNMDQQQQQQQQQGTAIIPDPGLGTLGVMGSEATPPGDTNQQLRQNGGMLRYIMEHILGPNESNPVWWLNLIAALSFVAAAMVGVLFLPRSLEGVHTTYWRVLLIMTVAVPMVVAVITVFISFWLKSDPDGRTNLTTALSVANISLLAGPLFFLLDGYSKLRGQESGRCYE